jgi:hypothetical protein
MKTQNLIVLVFLINQSLVAQQVLTADSLLKTNVIGMQAIGLGGYSGECIKVEIENFSDNVIKVEIESGRRFVSLDSGEQDILVVKPLIVTIQPKKKFLSKLFGFCCQASMRGPGKSSKFYKSYLAPKEWRELTQYLSQNAAIDVFTMQSAVWAMSDNRPIKNVGALNTTDVQLRKKLADIKKIIMPWYNISYKEKDLTPASDFNTAKPLMFNAELEVNIPHTGILNAYIMDKDKRIVNYLLQDSYTSEGKQTFIFNQSLVRYKKGKYKLIIQNENGFFLEKDFEI